MSPAHCFPPPTSLPQRSRNLRGLSEDISFRLTQFFCFLHCSRMILEFATAERCKIRRQITLKSLYLPWIYSWQCHASQILATLGMSSTCSAPNFRFQWRETEKERWLLSHDSCWCNRRHRRRLQGLSSPIYFGSLPKSSFSVTTRCIEISSRNWKHTCCSSVLSQMCYITRFLSACA